MYKWLKVLVAVLLLAGPQLAKSAGLHTDNKPGASNEAIKMLENSEASSGQESFSELNSKLISETDTIRKLVKERKSQEALVLSQKMMDKMLDRMEKADYGVEWLKRGSFLLYAHQAKAHALWQSRKHACSDRRLQPHLKNLKKMATEFEHIMEKEDPADVLGIEPNELGDQTKMRTIRRRLVTLLHPDKNMDLDEKTRKELGTIFDLANRTYDELLERLRN